MDAAAAAPRSFPLWYPPEFEPAWRELEQQRCIYAWLGRVEQLIQCRKELVAMRGRASARLAARMRRDSDFVNYANETGTNDQWHA
jgi:hypothetical protein